MTAIYSKIDQIDWFEPEHCYQHGEPVKADLVCRHLGSDKQENGLYTYCWRCPKCRVGWVTEGSDMEAFNTLVYAAFDRQQAAEEVGITAYVIKTTGVGGGPYK